MPILPPGRYEYREIENEAIYLHSLSIYRAPDHSQLTLHVMGVQLVGDFTPKLHRVNWDSDSLGNLPKIT